MEIHNPFKVKSGGKKVTHRVLIHNQGTFEDEQNLKVTLPDEDPSGSLGTARASGSGASLLGNNSTPNKRDREGSVDDTNPQKKQDVKKTPVKPSTEDVDDDDGDISDGESIQTNLTEKELSLHVEQVSLNDDPANYAGAAKKPKLDLPDLVYIQKGTDRREPIQRVHYDAFMDFLLQSIMKLTAEESSLIEIDWHGWGLGRGVIACLNPTTANYVKKVASEFSIRELRFRAWSKTEFGKREIFSGRLPGVTWKSRKPLETVKWIFNFNGLKNADFHLISYIKTPQGVIIRFESSRALTLALRRKNYVLNVGIAKLRLECKNSESGPINLPSDEINLEKADGNNSPNENAVEQT